MSKTYITPKRNNFRKQKSPVINDVKYARGADPRSEQSMGVSSSRLEFVVCDKCTAQGEPGVGLPVPIIILS